MPDDLIHELRISPKNSPALESVVTISRSGSWTVVSSNADTPGEEYKRVATWNVGQNLWVTYVQDLVSNESVVIVTGSEKESVDRLHRDLSEIMSPYSREEILNSFMEAETIGGASKSLVRMAMSTSREFDPEIFGVISTAARDEVPEIRLSAVWATVYLAWQQSDDLVREIASTDPNEQVRKMCRTVLNGTSDSPGS